MIFYLIVDEPAVLSEPSSRESEIVDEPAVLSEPSSRE